MSRTSHSSATNPSDTASQQQSTSPITPVAKRKPAIVAALSLKGGVGKTSVVLGLASSAAATGLKVLVVDLDPQANSTATLKPSATPFSVSDVLYDARLGIASDAIVSSSWPGSLDLIPSEPALEHRSQSPGPGSEFRLRTALEGVANQYDLVIFDCPPSLGELTRNALYAASAALVVTEPTFFAVQGAAQAIEAINIVSTNGNPELEPVGIVVNRMRTTLEDHRTHLSNLEQEFGDLVLGALPDRSAVPQAQSACLPVQQLQSNGAADISQALDLLLARIIAVPNNEPATPEIDLTESDQSDSETGGSLVGDNTPNVDLTSALAWSNESAEASHAHLTPTYRFTTSEK